MTTLIPTAILLISLGGGASVSPRSAGTQQWRADATLSSNQESEAAALSSLLGAVNAASRSENPWERVSRTVFVVPGPETTGEGIAQISEDMAIMCGIFNKTLLWALRTTGGGPDLAARFGGSGGVILDTRSSTQGLYLDGYGAIFFVPVDFPLAPPRQEETSAQSEPSADPLWSQTADELRGVAQQPDAPRPRYDAEKVERLKTSAIGLLRHASNLRTTRTQGRQDVIDVVIGNGMIRTGSHEWMFGSDRWERNELRVPQQAAEPAGSAGEMPTVLILRATRADVDAFAKGDLTQEQFAGKVQVLKSWTNAGREAIRATVPGSSGSTTPRSTR